MGWLDHHACTDTPIRGTIVERSEDTRGGFIKDVVQEALAPGDAGDAAGLRGAGSARRGHLLKTKGSCLGGKTFRDKIKSMGTYKTGAWSSGAVRGTCDVDLGNNYSSTSGFKYATCSSDIGKAKSVSFFADWGSGDGAVMMIGGGGGSCARADHGVAITEGNDAQFGSTCSGCNTRYDFGDPTSNATSYALNLFVR